MKLVGILVAIVALAALQSGCGTAGQASVQADFSISKDPVPPLQAEVERGNLSGVNRLLAEGVRVNARDETGATALHTAAELCRLDMVQILMDHGAKVNVADEAGRTPLMRAAGYGPEQLVRLRVPREGDGDGETPGEEHRDSAAAYRYADMVRYLLARGADPDVQDRTGATALHLAVARYHVDVAEELLKGGASVDEQDRNGGTPLRWAVDYGHDDLVELFLAHGADAIAADRIGWTPLHAAAEGGSLKMLSDLLKAGAPVNARDKTGDSPLHIAAEEGRVDVTATLLAAGADPRLADLSGATALHHAAKAGWPLTVRLLLASDVDVNARDNNGMTPLHWVMAFSRVVEAGRYAKDGTPEVTERDLRNSAKLVAILMAAGGDPTIRDARGRTPYDIAVERHVENGEVARTLRPRK